MSIQLTVFFQAAIFIIVMTLIIKLVMTVFRMAKSLEGIDETLHQISKKLDDKDKNHPIDENKN